MIKGKVKIFQTSLSDFNVEQINGSPFYKRYNEFMRIFKNRLKDVEPDVLFAEPLENLSSGAIDWYIFPPKNEQPIKLSELMADEKEHYALMKENAIRRLKEIYQGINNYNERAYFDCILKNVDNADIDDVVYCYDDHITFALWGMCVRRGKEYSTVITDTVKDHRIHTITYRIEGKGHFEGQTSILRRHGHILGGPKDIPTVIAGDRHTFTRWNPTAPNGKSVTEDMEFVAVCEHGDKYLVNFTAGEGGRLEGTCSLEIGKGMPILQNPLPIPTPDPGYQFAGWSPIMTMETLVFSDCTYEALFEQAPDIVPPPPLPEPTMHNVNFVAGENGLLPEGFVPFQVQDGSVIDSSWVPQVTPKEGFEFAGWDKPIVHPITEDTTFTALYKEVKLPWWKRFWAWLMGSGCLLWLLRILFILLLIALGVVLFRSCLGCAGSALLNGVAPIPTITTPDGRQIEDNGRVRPITGDDGTLPEGTDPIAAPVVGEDGSLPPIDEHEGAPSTIGNRLVLFMEDENGDLDGLARDFKTAYPGDAYSIIGMDRNVKMLVIQVPENERDNIRETINTKIPNHKFFVFDEEIYELNGFEPYASNNPGWHLDAIHLKQGWQVTKGSPEVKIAVVDDGIEAEHPMFKDRIVDAYNVFAQSNELSLGAGHGTHTAGLAAGSAEFYGRGASGVAPDCKLMPVQVFDNGMCPLSALVAGVMYSVNHGADVVNISIGPSFHGLDALPVESQEEIASNQFQNVAKLWDRVCKIASSKNIILVFAAGNDDIISSVPPENRSSSAIVVTAVDKSLCPTDFTNYGPCSDISAPGKDINSSFPRGTFKSEDGTSMSAPIIAGTIALMKSLKKDLTVQQARNVLYRTGADVYGYIPPMVQVDKALQGVKSGDFSVPNVREMRPVPDGSGDGASAGRATQPPAIVGVPITEVGDVIGGISVTPGSGTVGGGVSVGGSVDGSVSVGGTASGAVGGTTPAGGNTPGNGNASPGRGGTTTPGNTTDYDAILRQIKEHEDAIKDLKRQLQNAS